MKNRARLERLKKELRRKQPEEMPCTFSYDPDDKNKDLQIKRHLEKCKSKKRHYILPIFKGRILVPKA